MTYQREQQNFGCACGPVTGGSLWWRIAIGAFIAGNTMTVALAINLSEATAVERLTVQCIIMTATLLVMALLGGPLLRETFDSIRRREIKIEALFTLSWIGAVVASLVSVMRGSGPVFFEVASILLVVYSLGRELGRYSTQKALRSLSEWNPYDHRCLVVQEDGASVVETAIARVTPGDRVRVHPGQMVPVDGIIEQGRAFVHQADLTGESFAVSLGAGDSVLAGSHVLDATLDVRAIAAGTERTVDRITAVLDALRNAPSDWQIMANRLMQWFLPVLLVICGGVWWYWYVHEGWATALFNTMAVLLVACPCVLGFATPLAVWTGIGKLAASGLLAKNGAALEKLAAVDTLVFDKTGTLTLVDAPSAKLDVTPTSELDPLLVRQLVVATEEHCQHPIAQALRHLEGTAGDCVAESLEVLPGVGVQARVRRSSGGTYIVKIGSMSGQLGVWIDNRLCGSVTLEECIWDGIATVVRELQDIGVRCVLMTGDNSARASRIPIAEQHASLTPGQKRGRIQQLVAEKRRVLFTGDGTNDAAAMAASTVSIAVAEGSPLALDVADFVWTRQDLRVLPQAILTCREIARTIRSNVWLALGYNLAGITLAALGLLHPVAATLLMLCSSALVTWRSLRLLPATIEQPPAVEELA